MYLDGIENDKVSFSLLVFFTRFVAFGIGRGSTATRLKLCTKIASGHDELHSRSFYHTILLQSTSLLSIAPLPDSSNRFL